jgi:hypothetical protein
MSYVTDHLEQTPSIEWEANGALAEASFDAPWDGWIVMKAAADADAILWGVGLEQLDLPKPQDGTLVYPVAAGEAVQVRITDGAARAGDPVSDDFQFLPRAAAVEIPDVAFSNTAPSARSVDETAWDDVKVALTDGSSPTLVANGTIVDGVVLATGDRFVRTGSGAAVGIYRVAAGASTRTDDALVAAHFDYGRAVRVTHGSAANRGRWVFLTAGSITLGTTSLVISKASADPVPIS